MAGKVAFTASRVAGFKCPTDRAQAFLWDKASPGLGLRVTPAGKPAYVFQGQFQQKTIRITIGKPSAWSIPEAQAKARELQRLIDEGLDPRTIKAEQKAVQAAKLAEMQAQAVTVGEVWLEYLQERRPFWSERHYLDHIQNTSPGGKSIKGKPGKLTRPGVLVPLLSLRLVELQNPVVDGWAAKEAKRRPSRVRLALRHLKAFLRWVGEHHRYGDMVNTTAASSRKARDAAGRQKPRTGNLQREQLATWFQHIRQIQNPVTAAYFQCLLLTGARPAEMAALKWEDVNFQWRGITLNDKVEDSRAVPLTPYVAYLLQSLPRRNKWVFSSLRNPTGRISNPRNIYLKAMGAAGLSVTFYDLRRSFKSLTEWLEVPVGVVAQIMGHKPSATAEKHYTIRPLDLLRVHHEKIEAWILEQAGVPFDASTTASGLRVVKI